MVISSLLFTYTVCALNNIGVNPNLLWGQTMQGPDGPQSEGSLEKVRSPQFRGRGLSPRKV